MAPRSDRPLPEKDVPARQPGGLGLNYWNRDSYASTALFDILDRSFHAAVARFTGGLSPRALTGAWLDWAAGLSFAPGKRAQLNDKALRKMMRLNSYILSRMLQQDPQDSAIAPLPQDRRFADPAWANPPYDIMVQAFLLTQQWWHVATTDVDGVSPAHARMMEFTARQWLDLFAPSNYMLTNPVLANHTLHSGGENLLRGFQNWMEDWQRAIAGRPPVGTEAFVVGRDMAVTPGKVVYRNRLMELIQYEPATDQVQAEPVLITPAWIMKYYILDLTPESSLVRYLVGQGHTVFMISWKNPGPEDRDTSLTDYMELGPMAALKAIGERVPDQPVHGVGYCLGGTLKAITAAALAKRGESAFKTLTFFATQVDFEEAGELMLFINDQQVAFLEDMMWEQGVLDTQQMAGAFQLLRSNDLIWSKITHDYLMGERHEMNALMAWNADATRMPYKMHADYLRQLFLHNDLAEGRYHVDGHPVALTDIRAPIFVVATTKDHVAPWRSVYKFRLLTDTDVTFLLTNGGHNAGIVSEIGHKGRRYQVATAKAHDRYIPPDRWEAETPYKSGSWWPEWVAWLDSHSSGKTAPPPIRGVDMADPLPDAPGRYVLMP
ncbi:MAG: PHA/PHB synthase family protein [Rhodothalassiaceae bacterium]